MNAYIDYIDPDTILRKGDLVKMWELHDSKTTQTVAGNLFLSGKIQSEYDCAEERSRRLSITEFSGNMGSGEVVYTQVPRRRVDTYRTT
jgi:hypothetical protein